MAKPIVAITMSHHVAETGWWIRVVVACIMLGTAMAIKHKDEMTFVSAVMSFVGLVALPSVATWSGIVDGAFENPLRTLGGGVAMIALLFLVPFLIGLISGDSASKDTTSLLHPDNKESETVTSQEMGFVITTVAVLGVIMIDTVPENITNVMMSLLIVPLAMGAARLGSSITDPQKTTRMHSVTQEMGSRLLMTLFGIFLVIVLLSLKRSVVSAGIPSIPLEVVVSKQHSQN